MLSANIRLYGPLRFRLVTIITEILTQIQCVCPKKMWHLTTNQCSENKRYPIEQKHSWIDGLYHMSYTGYVYSCFCYCFRRKNVPNMKWRDTLLLLYTYILCSIILTIIFYDHFAYFCRKLLIANKRMRRICNRDQVRRPSNIKCQPNNNKKLCGNVKPIFVDGLAESQR